MYGADFLGRDVVRGYGSCLVPLVPGTHTVDVEMYTPMASSFLNNLASWFWGNPPEVRRVMKTALLILCLTHLRVV